KERSCLTLMSQDSNVAAFSNCGKLALQKPGHAQSSQPRPRKACTPSRTQRAHSSAHAAAIFCAAGEYWIASNVSSSNRSAAPRNAATCLRHSLTSSTGQHSSCSSINRRNLSTPYSSPPSFSASLIPSVYSTTVSPGDICALTTSTLSSEKKPSGLQLLSKVCTPDLPASNTGKWPAFAISISPWFEMLPNTRVAYWLASALSWKSRLARTISSATGSRSGIREWKTARKFDASMAAATPLPETSAMMKWRCPSSLITSQ